MRNYIKEIRKCETINEMAWVYADCAEDKGSDFIKVWREYQARRKEMEAAGQKYTRATKPSWMK